MVGAFDVEREEHGGIAAPHDAGRYERHVVLPNQTEGSHPKGGLVRVLDDDGDVLAVETFDDDRLDGANRVLIDGRIADEPNLGRPGSAHDLETVGDLAFVSGQASNRLNVYRLR